MSLAMKDGEQPSLGIEVEVRRSNLDKQVES